MPGKAVHILHPLRLPSGSSHPAHAAAQGYPHTGHPALEWPQHQFIAAHQVETHPIEFAQFLEQQSAELCGVGNEVPFIGQQCLQLRGQQRIACALGVGLLKVDHAWLSRSCNPTQCRAN
ncbi:hypothetical protein D3C84_261900 [compost metagenome]